MTREIEPELRNIISKEMEMDISMIGLEDNLIELGLNSISFIKSVIDIESEFGIGFAEEDLVINNFENLKMFISYVESRL